MTLKWEEPYHDGGSKVTGYWIEKKERNNILWVRENKIPCFECYYKVEALVEGLEYQFRVYAMNSAGLSKASEASKGAVAQNPVGKCEHSLWGSTRFCFKAPKCSSPLSCYFLFRPTK